MNMSALQCVEERAAANGPPIVDFPVGGNDFFLFSFHFDLFRFESKVAFHKPLEHF